MTSLTRKDIVGALGEVDDIVIAEIMALDATEDELAEAQAWLVNNEPLMNSGKSLPTGRVGQLVEVLQAVEEQEPGPAGHRA